MLELIAVGLSIWGTYRLVRVILMKRYFASEEFLAHKAQIAAVVAEHNEVGRYTAEIRDKGLFQVGASATGTHAHLASFQNTSHWNYRRDRNVAQYQATNVHNCSLQVVRNAHADPLKYVMKYFGIKADEATLGQVEQLNDSIVRLEAAVNNLHEREASITKAVNPPRFIQKHYLKQFMEQVGVELSPITVPYPVYVFEYVSAGGNSSQRASVTFDTPTTDALIETLGQKIRWRKSAAGQRALMTTKLRNSIKERDNHTCQYCSVSLAAEPHLLLEVDHIVPVSKGGMSMPDNLQTLCWRCNRSKSNKEPVATTSAGHADAPKTAVKVNTDQGDIGSVAVTPVGGGKHLAASVPESVTPVLSAPSESTETSSTAPTAPESATPTWRPGDIVNGHILGNDNQWHPLAER